MEYTSSLVKKLRHTRYYTGLLPRVTSSGEINHYGHIIKKACKPLKRVIVQVAWSFVRFSEPSQETTLLRLKTGNPASTLQGFEGIGEYFLDASLENHFFLDAFHIFIKGALMKKSVFHDLAELEQDIQRERRPFRVIVFLGTENHLYERLIKTYYSRIQSAYSSSEIISINGLETQVSEFHTELFTVPLFVSARLVVLKHADNLLKEISKNQKVLKHFNHDIQNWPEAVFGFLQLDTSSTSSVLKKLQDLGITYAYQPPKGNQISHYFKKKALELNYEIDETAIQTLLVKSAWDFRHTEKIFDQLTENLFTKSEREQEKRKITTEVIHEYYDDSESDLYFEITEQASSKKIKDCIEKLNHHKFEDGMEILYALSRLFSDSYRYRYFKRLGLPHEDILERLNIKNAHPYMIKKTIERLQNTLYHYSERSIPFIFKRLNVLDKRLKTEPREKHLSLLTMFMASLENC